MSTYKYILFLAFFLNIIFGAKIVSAQKTTQHQKQTVTITVTQTQSWCGGIAPPSSYGELSPLISKKLYLKKGTTNNATDKIIDTLTTNNLGQCVLKLKTGNYYIVDAVKVKPFVLKPNDEFHIYDSLCLYQNWKTPNLILKVNGSKIKAKYAINFNNYCYHAQPCCSKFTGWLPE